jgi:protein-L-isoaspartate O-methyltransferase
MLNHKEQNKMNITSKHQLDRFTQAEVQELIKGGRIYAMDREDGGRYPLVVFSEPLNPAWNAADAWMIDAAGVKDPDHATCPVPVWMSDVLHLDFAPPSLRAEILEYALARPKTYAFGLPADDKICGLRAFGVGPTQEVARVDAIARLLARFPQLGKSAKVLHSDALPAKLLHALRDCSAVVMNTIKGVIPGSEATGHDFATNETHVVVCVLQSQGAGSSAPVDAVEARARWFKVGKGQLDSEQLELVDWWEVADSISPEVEVARQVVPAAPLWVAPAGPVVSGRSIDPDVLSILGRCTVEGSGIRLPAEKLDRRLYEKVNEVLTALGGKWKGGKVQAHKFDEDPGDILAAVLATGSFTKPQDFGFFPTPPELVERVLAMVRIEPGMHLMEPSAGSGAFAVPMARMVGSMDAVTAYELLSQNVKLLREAGLTDVRQGDFLQVEPEPIFNLVIMNPPFSGGADMAHVMHATRFLKPDGELVAITSASWKFNGNKKSQAFREFVDLVEADVEDVAAGAFRASGTNVSTQIIRMDACNFPWNQVEQVRRRERASC